MYHMFFLMRVVIYYRYYYMFSLEPIENK